MSTKSYASYIDIPKLAMELATADLKR